MNIGNQISNIRKENQLTQEEFGKLFYVTRQIVSNWENGVSQTKRILRNNLCLPVCNKKQYYSVLYKILNS